MDNNNLRQLYDNVSKEYDLPDYNTFVNDMQNEENLKSFYSAISADYELPNYDQFVMDMGLKKKEAPTKDSGIPSAPSAPSGREGKIRELTVKATEAQAKGDTATLSTIKAQLDQLNQPQQVEQPREEVDLRALDVAMPTEQRQEIKDVSFKGAQLEKEKEQVSRLIKEDEARFPGMTPMEISAARSKIELERQKRAELDEKFFPEKLRKRWQELNMNSFEKIESEEQKKVSNIKATFSEPFLTAAGIITPEFIGRQEEEVLPILRERFSKYGFTFEKTGVGDAMVVRTTKGDNFVEIDLDPFTGQGERDNAQALLRFLKENASEPKNEIDSTYLDKVEKIQGIREVGRLNEDGSISTVMLTSFEEDGKYKVIPTLFPKDVNNYTMRKDDWMELPFDQALDVARSRGEVFEFKTKEEAEKFAQGDWKNKSTIDLEGNRFYKKFGMDYKSSMENYDQYIKVRDEKLEIERLLDEAEGVEDKYGWKEQAKKRVEELSKKENELFQFAYDSEFRDARDKFDVYLQGKYKQRAEKSAIYGAISDDIQVQLDQESMRLFNVPASRLSDVTPKNEEEKAIIDRIINTYVSSKSIRDIAAKEYAMSNMYFNRKANKAITKDLVDGVSGLTDAVSDGWNRGQAGKIIALIGAGVYDIKDPKVLDEYAKEISERLSDVNSVESKQMARWVETVTTKEMAKTVMQSPDVLLAWAGNSLSQMLPVGLQIVPAFTATGATVGAGVGATVGGPVGAAAGASKGAQQGFRLGMAATNYAVEYFSAIIETAEKKGYDMQNPENVAMALQDRTVWEEGGKRGFDRGVPIAVVDYLTAGLSGRVFGVSRLASAPKRIASQVAERLVVDPITEGFGEALAQINADGRINTKEILEEMGGGIGSNTSNMVVNYAYSRAVKDNTNYARSLTNPMNIVNESATDEEIMGFADRMKTMGKISNEEYTAIRNNVSSRRAADDVVSVGVMSGKKTKAAQARVVELMNARDELSATTNRRELYGKKISEINEEIRYISENKKMLPAEQQTNLDILGISSNKSSYIVDGKVFRSRKDVMDYVGKMDKKDLSMAEIIIANDEELNNDISKLRRDAIQEQTTDESVLRTEQPEMGLQEMVEGDQEQEVVTPTSVQEEVVPERNATEFSYETLETQPLNVLEEKLVENEALLQTAIDNNDTNAQEFITPFIDSLKVEIEKAKTIPVAVNETQQRIDVLQQAINNALSKTPDGVTPIAVEVNGTLESFQDVKRELDSLMQQPKAAPIEVTPIEVAPIEVAAEVSTQTETPAAEDISQEVQDLLGIIEQGDARFRLSEETEQVANQAEVDAIAERMLQLGPVEVNFTEPSVSDITVKVNPLEDTKAEKKMPEGLAELLGIKTYNEIAGKVMKPISFFNGIPMITGMSDMLASGTVKDSAGNDMYIGGGILFNVLGKNTGLAWAGVDENGATRQYEAALKLYNNNKVLFDKLWAEGKLPQGHVPMAIMAMANTAINSNEAVFRWLSPYIASLPKKNRVAALNELKTILSKKLVSSAETSWIVALDEAIKSGSVESLQQIIDNITAQKKNASQKKIETIDNFVKKLQRISNDKKIPEDQKLDDAYELVNEKIEAASMSKILGFINSDKSIKTLDQLFDKVVEDANKRSQNVSDSILSLTDRANLSDLILAKTYSKGTKGTGVVQVLNQGVKNFNMKNFTFPGVYEAIGEKSMANAKQGEVVAIVGIDVINGGVQNIPIDQHGNYGYGPKGRAIAIMETPIHGIDVFPEWRAKASRIFKQNKKGVAPDSESVASQTAGTFFSDLAFQGARVVFNDGKMSDLDVLIGKLRFAFPSVSVSTSAVEFDAAMKQVGVRKRTVNGRTVYGITKDGKIFLNPDTNSLATPIHEFGHIWIDYLRSESSGKKGEALLKRGLELVKGTKEYKVALEKYGDPELAAEEALVELMATKGETIINAAKKAEFKSWMNAVFKYIKTNLENIFVRSADLKLKNIDSMTLDEFIGTGLADLFAGSAVDNKFNPAEAVSSFRARFSLDDSLGIGTSLFDIISNARNLGFSDEVIAEVLKIRGFDKASIDNALEVKIDAFTPIPSEFGNITGGIITGKEMFMSVRNDLLKFIKKQKGNATMAEIRQKAFDLLNANETFKKQDDATKMKLTLAFDATLKTKANTQINKQMADIRRRISDINSGKNSLQNAKKAMYEFMKDALKDVKAISDRRAKSLLAIIAKSNEANIIANSEKVLEIVKDQIDADNRAEFKRLIKDQKDKLKQQKIGASTLRNAQVRLKNLIKDAFPANKQYSNYRKSQIDRISSLISSINEDNFNDKVSGILDMVDAQREKVKKAMVKKMLETSKRYASKRKTSAGKLRADGISASGQSYFRAAADVISKALSNDTQGMLDIATRLGTADNVKLINEATAKETRGETLTLQETEILDLLSAFNTFADVMMKGLEEVDVLLQDLNDGVDTHKTLYQQNKINRKNMIDAIIGQSNDEMRQNYPFLYSETGELLDNNQRSAKKDEIWESFNSLKFWDFTKKFVESYDTTDMKKFLSKVLRPMSNLQTLVNKIDNVNKGNTFFTKNVYDRINDSIELYLAGKQSQLDLIDRIANSITGKEGGYKVIRRGLFSGTKKITGLISSTNNKTYDKSFSADQLLRIYALSKNKVQRQKLLNQGITDAKLDYIKSLLSEESMLFVDEIVNYLSNDYFNSLNSVYSSINDVNLGYVENYFPTKTLASGVTGSMLVDGDFGAIFNADNAPSLKNRTNMSDDIDLSSDDFSNALGYYIDTMERYKAFADNINIVNAVLQSENVSVLMNEMGIAGVLKHLINTTVNPNSFRDVIGDNEIMSGLQNKYAGFALASKAIQSLKQASSFITGFEDYRFRSNNRTVVVDNVIDLLGYTYDMAGVMLTLPAQIKKFYNLSPSFRDRIDGHLRGDFGSLESGTRSKYSRLTQDSSLSDVRKFYRVALGSFMAVGDILGVIGYAPTFNRMVKNGMSEADALREFNRYNSTQQTKRGTELSSIQQSKSYLMRMFVMFGSSSILMMNRALFQSLPNIWNAIFVQGKPPRLKDWRAFYLSLGASNVLFTLASNLPLVFSNEDEDKETLRNRLIDAATGINLMYQIPILGYHIKQAMAHARGEEFYGSEVVNPIEGVVRKSIKLYNEDDLEGATRPVVELMLGTQLDPFMGAYNMFSADGGTPDDLYDALGISKSYRPAEKKSGSMDDLYNEEYEKYKKEYESRNKEYDKRNKEYEEYKKRNK